MKKRTIMTLCSMALLASAIGAPVYAAGNTAADAFGMTEQASADLAQEQLPQTEPETPTIITNQVADEAMAEKAAVTAGQETEPETNGQEKKAEKATNTETQQEETPNNTAETPATETEKAEKPWYSISLLEILMQLLVACVLIVIPGCWIYYRGKK